MPGRAAGWFVAWALLAAAAQRPAIGGAVTWLPAIDLQQGQARPLKEYAGPKGLVVFFWAGWSDRSIEELRRLDAAQKDIRDHGVGVVAVNVDHEAGAGNLDAIRKQAASLGITLPVVVDDGLKLFRAYGVVSVPSTAIVNEAGELARFLPGYSHEQRDALFDAIDALAGIEHVRAQAPIVRGAPAAVRRLQFGRTQLAGGRVPGARSSFEAAASADPAFADPLAELAALAIDEGDAARAQALIDKALALEKDSVLVRVEAARLRFVQGQDAEAIAALTQASPEDPLAQAYLGFTLLAAGGTAEASAAFAGVVKGGWPDPLAGSAMGASLPRAEAAARMVEYRRLTATKRR